MLKILRWTHEHVKGQFPESYSIIDDHALNIITRGYGTRDQIADVFTTLLAYVGVESRMHFRRGQKRHPLMAITTVWLGGHWRLFDPYNGVYFRTPQGEVATVEDFIAHPEKLVAVPVQSQIEGPSAVDFGRSLRSLDLSQGFSRGKLQMPTYRLWHELVGRRLGKTAGRK